MPHLQVTQIEKGINAEFDKLFKRLCGALLLYPWALPPSGGLFETNLARAQLLKGSRVLALGAGAALWDALVPTGVWGERGVEEQ